MLFLRGQMKIQSKIKTNKYLYYFNKKLNKLYKHLVFTLGLFLILLNENFIIVIKEDYLTSLFLWCNIFRLFERIGLYLLRKNRGRWLNWSIISICSWNWWRKLVTIENRQSINCTCCLALVLNRSQIKLRSTRSSTQWCSIYKTFSYHRGISSTYIA